MKVTSLALMASLAWAGVASAQDDPAQKLKQDVERQLKDLEKRVAELEKAAKEKIAAVKVKLDKGVKDVVKKLKSGKGCESWLEGMLKKMEPMLDQVEEQLSNLNWEEVQDMAQQFGIELPDQVQQQFEQVLEKAKEAIKQLKGKSKKPTEKHPAYY